MWKLHFRRTVLFGILGLLVALAIGLSSPKIYEGRTQLIVGEDLQNRAGLETMTADVKSILDRGAPRSSETELGVLASPGVFFQAFRRVAERENLNDIVKDFEKYYRMYNVSGQENSNAADITVKAFSPKMAADLANEVAAAYNQIRQSNARVSVNDALNYLSEQIVAAERDMTEAQEKLKAYKSENSLPNLDVQTGERVRNIEQMKVQAATVRAQLEGAESDVREYERQLARMTDETYTSMTVEQQSQAVQTYQGQLAALRNEREQLLGRFMPDAIEVKNKEQEIAQVEKLLRAEQQKPMTKAGRNVSPEPIRQQTRQDLVRAQVIRDNLQANLSQLESKIEEFQKKLDDAPAQQDMLVNLSRDVEIFDQKYRNLKRMSEDLKNRANVVSRPAAVTFSATENEDPVAPDLLKFSIVGALAGVCLGLIFSFGRESLKLRVHTSSQLAELTGLPVAATVPALPKAMMARNIKRLTQPDGQPFESFRYMAFSMLASDPNLKKTIMFTSTGNVQGASASALQLAISVARTGKKVVLVDANPRGRLLTNLVDMGGKNGLLDLAAAGADAEVNSYLHASVHNNLFVMPTGSEGKTDLINLSEQDFDRLMHKIKAAGDVVILHTAPCDLLADASRMARWADDVCLIISARSTNFRSVPNAYEILTRAGAKTVSLVLVDASLDDEPFSSAGRFITAR